MEGIRIYVHLPKNVIIIKEWGKENVSMINNIFSNRKPEKKKSNINVDDNPWVVGFISVGSNEY